MPTIRMPQSGELVAYDAGSYFAVANRYFAENDAIGRSIDKAATLQAFRAQAGEETSAFVYTPGAGAVSSIPASVGRVLSNPFVAASDAIMAATPTAVHDAWQRSSDGIVAAGGHAVDATKKAAAWLGDLLGQVPNAANKANNTLRIIAIAAAVTAGAVGLIYVTPLVAPLFRRK